MSLLNKIRRKINKRVEKLKKSLLVSFLNRQPRANNLDVTTMKKVLLLRLDGKVGDMVVATGTLHLLVEHGYQVLVLTKPVCQQLLKNCQYVTQVFLYEKNMSFHELRNQQFDVVIDLDNAEDYERLRLVWKLNAKCNIGFNKKSYNIYHQSIDFEFKKHHIIERNRKILQAFNISGDPFHYYIGLDYEWQKKVTNILGKDKDKITVAINPLTLIEEKNFSKKQIFDIIDYINLLKFNVQIVLIGEENKIKPFLRKNTLFMPGSTINTAVEIVRIADLIITQDTSIVHIARALNKKSINVYNNGELTNIFAHIVWSPNYDNGIQIIIPQKNICDYDISQLFPDIKNYSANCLIKNQ